MYAGDSLFTLSNGQIAGLVLLSAILFAALVWAVWRIPRRVPAWARLGVALLLFWLFLWLSPQVYYAYYLLIIDGLPLQIVIKSPPSPSHLLQTLGFSNRSSLADHGRGSLGWTMVAASLLRRRIDAT